MCVRPEAGDKIVSVRCQPRTYPCPSCGRHGRRKRRLDRFVRSLAYGRVLWLHVFYAEYSARCSCRKSFRSCPPDITPKADYDNLVRQAVLDRVLDDGLNAERTRAAMKRDFLLSAVQRLRLRLPGLGPGPAQPGPAAPRGPGAVQRPAVRR
jgi:hypothetical protein